MSKILFLEKKLRADKIGFCYLSTIMKDAGHMVDMIQDDVDNADDYIKKHNIDFLMLSVTSGEQDWFLNRNRQLKKKFKFKTIVGGPHFTYFPEEGEKDPYVDKVVTGPGDNVIVDILNDKYSEKVVRGSLPDMNKVREPDRSILYKYDEFGQSKMKRFMANRYCPFNCSYCFNHHYRDMYSDQKRFFKQLYPVDHMINEIVNVRDTYGLELAYFNDDNLAFNHTWLAEFCKQMKSINMKFCGSVRPDSVNKEVLKMMAEHGCTFLNMALEAGRDDSRKLLRRGRATFDRVKESAQLAMKYGIKIRIQNMIGLPVENPLEDALITLKCNQEINPDDSWVSLYQPYGGTDLWKYCLENGFIKDNFVAHGQYERTQFDFVEADELYNLSAWWFFIVKHKIPLEFTKILIKMNISEDQATELRNLRFETSKNLLYIL
jgi:radical SAM superfamily enzyme YgiQ (UPF0313 family)